MANAIKNTIQGVLGKERIMEICKKYHLDENEKKVINEILNEWNSPIINGDEKIEIAFEKVFHFFRRQKILCALFMISAEFAEKEIGKKMH